MTGVVTEAPSALSDGLGITIDDGTGPLRIVASTAALAGADRADRRRRPRGRDRWASADSSGTGASGYRLHATLTGELAVDPPLPSPTPLPSAGADATHAERPGEPVAAPERRPAAVAEPDPDPDADAGSIDRTQPEPQPQSEPCPDHDHDRRGADLRGRPPRDGESASSRPKPGGSARPRCSRSRTRRRGSSSGSATSTHGRCAARASR